MVKKAKGDRHEADHVSISVAEEAVQSDWEPWTLVSIH